MTSERLRGPARPRRLAVAIALLAVGACASSPPDGSRQYLDEKSAATVTVAEGSLVFARERPELAVHARDYLTIVPVDVNRMGTHVLYFYCFVWSTIDKRDSAAREDGTAQFETHRRRPADPARRSPGNATRARARRATGAPHRPDSARLLIALTDRETLAFLSRPRTRSAPSNCAMASSDRYELWSGNRGRAAAPSGRRQGTFSLSGTVPWRSSRRTVR